MQNEKSLWESQVPAKFAVNFVAVCTSNYKNKDAKPPLIEEEKQGSGRTFTIGLFPFAILTRDGRLSGLWKARHAIRRTVS